MPTRFHPERLGYHIHGFPCLRCHAGCPVCKSPLRPNMTRPDLTDRVTKAALEIAL
jgi:hypothetical protein